MKRTLIIWLIVFMGLLLGFQLFGGKNDEESPLDQKPVGMFVSKTSYHEGDEVIISVKNNTESAISIPNPCPKNPLRVMFLSGATPVEKTAEAELDCTAFKEITVEPDKTANITLAYWAHSLFGELGTYRMELPITIGEEEHTIFSNEFQIEKRGVFSLAWRNLLYQPIYNGLMFFVRYTPGMNLGIGIILLTILIRLLLLLPSQRAMKSQVRLQELQPKLEHIKKKYAGNQEKIAQETMELWKTHKVNPFGSCLPLLIQFPFLIAIFYVIRSGLNPDNIHLLYEPLKSLHIADINPHFLSMDLTKVNRFVLPLIVGVLQFAQMKLALSKKKKDDTSAGTEMAVANNMMMYAMPIMIAVFTASLPAGVGLYWGISTLFGVGQQVVANQSRLEP